MLLIYPTDLCVTEENHYARIPVDSCTCTSASHAPVNWSELLPPPPSPPPPGEVTTYSHLESQCNNLSSHSDTYGCPDNADNNPRCPLTPTSPVSRISACSCPAPHTHGGQGHSRGQGQGQVIYSDTDWTPYPRYQLDAYNYNRVRSPALTNPGDPAASLTCAHLSPCHTSLKATPHRGYPHPHLQQQHIPPTSCSGSDKADNSAEQTLEGGVFPSHLSENFNINQVGGASGSGHAHLPRDMSPPPTALQGYRMPLIEQSEHRNSSDGEQMVGGPGFLPPRGGGAYLSSDRSCPSAFSSVTTNKTSRAFDRR